MTRVAGGGIAILVVALLASCAQTPIANPIEPVARPVAFAEAIAARRQRAIADESGGDWSDAVAQWQILAILDPSDPTIPTRLAAARIGQREAAAQSFKAASAALAKGDTDEAQRKFVLTLSIDPLHADAAKAMREIESRRMARVQADRAARVRRGDEGAPSIASMRREEARSFDLEQSIALYSAGDTDHGLRDMKAYATENPADLPGRRRMADSVAEQGRRAEDAGDRETALNFYEQAAALVNENPHPWAARIKALRRTIVATYNAKAQHDSLTDLPLAIRSWEAALRVDPGNVEIAMQLQQARRIDAKLKRLSR